jgi:DNA-directed RNA polymerase alpha subunit
MKLSEKKRYSLIESILEGMSISKSAVEIGCPKSTANKIFETAIVKIWRETRRQNESKTYSIENARADKDLIIKHLHDYLSGDLFITKELLEPDYSIHSLGFMPNIANPLVRQNISTIEDLLTYSKKELMNFEGIGRASVATIEKLLTNYGFALKK